MAPALYDAELKPRFIENNRRFGQRQGRGNAIYPFNVIQPAYPTVLSIRVHFVDVLQPAVRPRREPDAMGRQLPALSGCTRSEVPLMNLRGGWNPLNT